MACHQPSLSKNSFVAAALEVGQRQAVRFGVLCCALAGACFVDPTPINLLTAAVGAEGWFWGSRLLRWMGKDDLSPETYKPPLVDLLMAPLVGVVFGCLVVALDKKIDKTFLHPLVGEPDYTALHLAKDEVLQRCPTLGATGEGDGYVWRVNSERTYRDLDDNDAVMTGISFSARIDHDVIQPAREGERPRLTHEQNSIAYRRNADGTCAEVGPQ
jgi:hypothetical protein